MTSGISRQQMPNQLVVLISIGTAKIQKESETEPRIRTEY